MHNPYLGVGSNATFQWNKQLATVGQLLVFFGNRLHRGSCCCPVATPIPPPSLPGKPPRPRRPAPGLGLLARGSRPRAASPGGGGTRAAPGGGNLGAAAPFPAAAGPALRQDAAPPRRGRAVPGRACAPPAGLGSGRGLGAGSAEPLPRSTGGQVNPPGRPGAPRGSTAGRALRDRLHVPPGRAPPGPPAAGRGPSVAGSALGSGPACGAGPGLAPFRSSPREFGPLPVGAGTSRVCVRVHSAKASLPVLIAQ